MELAADSGAVKPAAKSDEALWRRSLAGDSEAFGGLFDRHRDRVFAHACRVAPTRQDAEDVVASSFLELWRRRASVKLVQQSVLPWLLMTATNLGRNTTRGTRRYRALLERLPRPTDSRDVAEVVLDSPEYLDAGLGDGLRALNKTDAGLFVLVALEGYPVTVAAEQLGLSVSAARARLHRVRGKLKQRLGQPPAEAPAGDQGDKR